MTVCLVHSVAPSKLGSPYRKRNAPSSRPDASTVRSKSMSGSAWEAGGARASTRSGARDESMPPCSWWGPGPVLLRPIIKEGILKKRGGRINAWGDRHVLRLLRYSRGFCRHREELWECCVDAPPSLLLCLGACGRRNRFLRADICTWVCFFPSTCLNPVLITRRYFILREDLLEQYAKGENPVSLCF